MKYQIFVLMLILGYSTEAKRNGQDSQICKKLEFLKSYSNGKEVDGATLQENVSFMEEKTGIQSEYDGSFLGLKTPSKFTVKKWESWLIENEIKCYAACVESSTDSQ